MKISRQGKLRCVVCHGDDDGKLSVCPGCLATMHSECYTEIGRCPILGCVGPPRVYNQTCCAICYVGGNLAKCPKCLTYLHYRCFVSLGRCPILGCGNLPKVKNSQKSRRMTEWEEIASRFPSVEELEVSEEDNNEEGV